MLARLVSCVCLVCAASCGAPLMKLPSGPGAPAPDAADALAQATRGLPRRPHAHAPKSAASGTVGGQRFRARLLAGVAAPASARLEAVAPFGAPLFILVADNDEATLLLPRDERVLEHGRSADGARSGGRRAARRRRPAHAS